MHDMTAALQSLADKAVADHRTCGLAWGLVGGFGTDHELLASGGAGTTLIRDGQPDANSQVPGPRTISRIASMTKSFTAATILALRDEGRLRLDDAAANYVPELSEVLLPTADCPAITVRNLLTMSAGLVTDNPWGDRQEAMTRENFSTMLRAGLGFVHRPGTGFEYSNTGYVILGEIITRITGHSYADEIIQRFIKPLGMRDTAFDREGLDPQRIAAGHRLADREDATRFEPVPFDSPGVYGAMAGLYSTVEDVARWVRFLAAANSADAADQDQSLLSTASRREMQQAYRSLTPPVLPDGRGFDRLAGYGFGLVVERFPDLGEIISHSGGYPGYGSFMCWHRSSGLGMIVLANSKYAPGIALSMEAMRTVLRIEPQLLTRPKLRDGEPSQDPVDLAQLERKGQANESNLPLADRTRDAMRAAMDWLRTDDSALADQWFADNMDLDIPRAERRRRLDKAIADTGIDLGDDWPEPVVLSPAQVRWTFPGKVSNPDGEPKNLRIDLLMDPRAQALIQALDTVAVAPPKDESLSGIKSASSANADSDKAGSSSAS
ncbi:serine hydrolase domain-containing protein [Devriesea agamarum]|uniref:serine hydrolase domain-containing protein n=1 Tax=Devriesea agamarum TaxID=472569 RepID=UPI000A05364A|nr:serine hydrolase domain-containing protein [Devriesea agamarum]